MPTDRLYKLLNCRFCIRCCRKQFVTTKTSFLMLYISTLSSSQRHRRPHFKPYVREQQAVWNFVFNGGSGVTRRLLKMTLRKMTAHYLETNWVIKYPNYGYILPFVICKRVSSKLSFTEPNWSSMMILSFTGPNWLSMMILSFTEPYWSSMMILSFTVKMDCQYDKVPRPRGDASDTGAHHICHPAL